MTCYSVTLNSFFEMFVNHHKIKTYLTCIGLYLCSQLGVTESRDVDLLTDIQVGCHSRIIPDGYFLFRLGLVVVHCFLTDLLPAAPSTMCRTLWRLQTLLCSTAA